MSSASEKFCAHLEMLGSPAPWRLCGEEVGVILDANGAAVLTVDANNERKDEAVRLICLLIVLAVNTCAGFKAKNVRPEPEA